MISNILNWLKKFKSQNPPVPKAFKKKNTSIFLNKYSTLIYFIVVWHVFGYVLISNAKKQADSEGMELHRILAQGKNYGSLIMADLALSNDLFFKFHQLQINLIKTPSKESISDYHNCLVLYFNQSSIHQPNAQSAKLIEFFTYPILTVLKRFQLNSDSNEILLKSCGLIITKIQLNDLNIFHDIFNTISILLSNKKSSPSEEFVCTCFQVIETLFKCENLSKFYKFSNLTSIGLTISLCLDTLVQSNSLEVKLKAISALKSLLNQHKEKLFVLLPSFLPGISIKLVQKFLLTQNLKLINHKAVCAVLDIFGHAISIVFNDQLLDPKVYQAYFDACNGTELNPKVKDLIINRSENDQWLLQSSEKMFFLIEKMLQALITTENVHIQMSLVKFCASISENCYFTLNNYLPKLLRILVTFAVSDSENVAKLALKSIDMLDTKETIEEKNSKNFILHNKFSILDSCFEQILIKLPRLMQTKSSAKCEINDEYRKSNLKTLYGYLKLVGDSQNFGIKNFFLLNSNHVRHLIEALLSCVQFNFKNLNNFYEIDSRDDFMKKSKSLSNYSGLNTYLEDTVLYEQLTQICEYLGRSDSLRLLMDELLTRDLVCSENGFLKLEVMFIIDLLLSGLNKKKNSLCQKELTSIIGLILNNFLTDFTNLTEKGVEEIEAVSTSIGYRNKLIIQTCLTLESIRLSSQLLHPSNYNLFLIDTLYFILENYLNNNLLIRVVSTQCLVELATNLEYKNIQDLLSKNFDYIMNDLILKSTNQNSLLKSDMDMNNDDLNKQSSHVFVLCALLEISNSDIVPYLGRIFDEFFLSIQINPFEIRLILGVCRIMSFMAKSVAKWYPIKFNFIEEDKAQDDLVNLNLKKVAQVRKKSDYSKSFRQTLEDIDEMREKIYESKSDNSVQEDDKKVPEYVKLETKCFELSIHLISHPSRQVRVQIIDLVRELSKNMAEYTNEFLPLVHKLWSPICQRFSLDDLIVKSKIIQLLYDLSILCSDFISSRFCKEFLPRLSTFMRDQSVVSARSTKVEGSNVGDATYVYSHAFKLQSSILANLDKMCILFEIKDLELETLVDSCVLVYLDSMQPRKLQYSALEACKNCALIDADVVWLSLHYVIPFKKILSQELAQSFLEKLDYSSGIKPKYNFSLNQDILYSLLSIFSEI
ncbi:TELO2-interacting 1 -like protein [Brachionus plicatilis]|uniref:TELO2-interacting 1-like protein n=1 Tax=Brachionus plicatilis TaxID=10195 RepID=A0A3M7RRC7_BRAPC|nr:TELO2-interacting 1 -like protein [Brachionus plicatilis]